MNLISPAPPRASQGCEFSWLSPFLKNVHTEQLLVEVHGSMRPSKVEALMLAFNRTHGIFYREPNLLFTDGTYIEFALRRRGGRKLRKRPM
jgi:hypothetical protein